MPGMNAATIAPTSNSKPALIYRRLMETPGKWVSAWELVEAAGSMTALSTHVAAVRKNVRLSGGDVKHEARDGKNYYRIVGVGEQMELMG